MLSLKFREQLPPVVADEFDQLIAQLRGFLAEAHNEDGSLFVAAPDGIVPVGAMLEWGTTAAPEKWLICDGSQVSRVTYKPLFDLWGTTFGAGDGSTTFNLPDFRQRFALGKAAAGTGASIGATGGAIDHTHSESAHTHSFSATSAGGGGHDHSGATGSNGSHTHGMSELNSAATSTAGSTTLNYTTGGDALNVAVGGHAHFTTTSTKTTDSGGSHTHSINNAPDHTHGVSGTTGSSSGTTGTANPPYLVVNKIVYSGV